MQTNTTFYSDFSDEQLFIFVKQDNRKAFEEIYNRYWSYLLDYAYKPLQSRQKAEDIVQEIFISLYQRRHSIELLVSLKAYLSKALKFKVLNELRSQIVRDTYQKNAFLNTSSKIDFVCHLETKELQRNLHKQIQELPDKCKRAFLLSREENLSYKDISGGLGISVSTVEKHIIKALKTLKVKLNV